YTMTDGDYYLYAAGKDLAGNWARTSEKMITIDNTPPESTILIPANEGHESVVITNDWDGSLSGEASDNLSGVARVELEIDYNGSTTIATASGTTAWTYNLPGVPEGTYTISSHAVDNAGNRENTYEVTIVLDKTIPEVDLTVTPTDPDGSGNWYITRPEVTLTDSDNFAVDYIQYRWGATGSWNTYSAPLLLPAEGTNPLYYRAVDQAGNLSEEGIKTLQWDQTELTEGPLNIKADPNPTADSSSTISWDDATDNIGINKYQITWDLRDGDDKHSKEVAGDVTETEINELKEGSYKITVTAYDGSGYNRSASTTLIVDRTAPVAPSLTLTASRAGEVDLSWTTVADADRYIIYYGLEAGNYLYAADVGNVTNYTVQGLTAGNYYFVVRAVDESDNQGANSNEVSILALTGAPAGTIVAEGFTEAGVVQGETTEASAEEQAAMNEEIAKQGEVKGAAITCTNLSKSLFWIFLVVQAVIMLLLAKFSKRAWLKLLAFLLLPALFTVIIRRMGLANCFSNETMIWLSNNYYLPAYLA
ncbi:MAG TPA: Ig-like domain-containing protein, partial [Candidatus Woesebacteria bacterium]|nr:Ig-like domain-containing protein [Candidatus Woesebacteria bacterium]